MQEGWLVLALGILSSTACIASDSVETPWTHADKVFSCAVHASEHKQVVRLNKRPSSGGELGVETPDGDFFFMVPVDAATTGMPNLDAEEFSRMTSLDLDPDSLIGTSSRHESRAKVFARPGKYTFYLSDNLESEEGGYTCDVMFDRQLHTP